MLILKFFSTHVALLDFIVYSYERVMTHNCTIRCHPDEDAFPFGSGSSQRFFLLTS